MRGVHFPLETAPADIGWKALAVNLSDLAAMGATPAWCTLSLTLPDADAEWVDALPRRLPRAGRAARRRAGRRRHDARPAVGPHHWLQKMQHIIKTNFLHLQVSHA